VTEVDLRVGGDVRVVMRDPHVVRFTHSGLWDEEAGARTRRLGRVQPSARAAGEDCGS
jgi:hypothetical protein